MTRGGAGRGQGRKSLSPAEPTLVRSIRMPASLWAKLERLGGAEWIRRKIIKAKVDEGVNAIKSNRDS